MDYARIRTQIVKRPTGISIYVRAPRGLGQTPAPSSIDVTAAFNAYAPSASDVLQSGVFNQGYIPTAAGPVVPSSSLLYPLTIAPPGSTQQSTLQSAAQTLAAGAGSLTSLIFPKVQTATAQPQAAPGSGITNWLGQSSGVGGLSNQVLIAGALGLGIVVMLLGRRR